jgi:mono/diheme cytochrome c family protein
MGETGSNAIAFSAVACGILLAAGGLHAGERPPHDPSAAAKGAMIYRTYCASCHGKDARGDGALASRLKVAPPNLTRLGRRGRFSFDEVNRIIDGQRPLRGHGGPDMPVWGDAFLESRDGYDGAKVKEKIAQLTHFLASIQKEDGPAKTQPASAVCVFSNPASRAVAPKPRRWPRVRRPARPVRRSSRASTTPRASRRTAWRRRFARAGSWTRWRPA